MLKKKLVKQAVEVLRDVNKKYYEDSSKKKPLLEDEKESTLYLQVTLKKIPESKLINMIKVSLPHPLLKDSHEVCLILGDLDKKNHKAEIEPDILHYKQLLEKHDITCISQVITLRQLRTDYKPYEAKQKLLAAFDMFLADRKIMECLPKVLGRHFFKKRKFPVQVDMKSSNLKNQIEKALSTKIFPVTGHGNSCCSEVAYLDMDDSEIIDNIMEVTKTLSDQLPGLWNNIMGIYLKTSKSKAIPVYMSYEKFNEIEVKDEKEEEIEDELSTFPRVKVKVYSDGTVETSRLKEELESGESEEENSNEIEIKEELENGESKVENTNPKELEKSKKGIKNCKTKKKKIEAETTLLDFDLDKTEDKTKESTTEKEKDESKMVFSESELKGLKKEAKKSKAKKKKAVEVESSDSNLQEPKVEDKKLRTKKKRNEAEMVLFDSNLEKEENETRKFKAKKKNCEIKSVLSDSDEFNIGKTKFIQAMKKAKRENKILEKLLLHGSSVRAGIEEMNSQDSVKETKRSRKTKKGLIESDSLFVSNDVEDENVSKQIRRKKIKEECFATVCSSEKSIEEMNSQDSVKETKRSRKTKKGLIENDSLFVSNDFEVENGSKQIRRKKIKEECFATDYSSEKKSIKNKNPRQAKRKQTESELASSDLLETENNFEIQEQALKKRKIDGINMKRYNTRKDSRKNKKKENRQKYKP